MRIRSVKPDFWRDTVTGEMGPQLALFYLGLACFSDDGGRFEWDLRLLRADLDPFDTKFGGPSGIAVLLGQLLAAGRIRTYEVEGKKYGEIPSFARHQHPQKPSMRCPVPVRDSSCTPPGPVSPGSGVGSGSGSGSGTGSGEAPASTAEAQALAPWEHFRNHLADRIAVPRDWLRVASADRVAQVREQLDSEVSRLGMARAVEVAFEAWVKSQKKPQWLAYYVGPLQDAPRHAASQDAWQGESPKPPGGEAWPEPTPEQVAEWEKQAKAELAATGRVS
jgi:hypothetical protein